MSVSDNMQRLNAKAAAEAVDASRPRGSIASYSKYREAERLSTGSPTRVRRRAQRDRG